MGREERARKAPANPARTNPKGESRDVRIGGVGGQHQRILIRNMFKGDDPRSSVPRAGGPDDYRVVLTLTRPGTPPVGEREFSFDPAIPGDSQLGVAPPATTSLFAEPVLDGEVVMEVQTAAVNGLAIVFHGHPNKQGFLGRLETTLRANSFKDAEHEAHRAIAPLLSSWASQLDIPLMIWRIHVTATTTGSMQISIVNPFVESALTLANEFALSPDLGRFASFYREALESNSPVYQFICLFKITEGLFKRRKQLASEARTRGEQVRRPVEQIPNDPPEFTAWLNALYPAPRDWDDMALDSIFIAEDRGRKFQVIFEKQLTDLRTDVAHALSDETGSVMVSADEALHIHRVNRWLPLLKVMVRRMFKNDFPAEFLPGVPESTSIDKSSAVQGGLSADELVEIMSRGRR